MTWAQMKVDPAELSRRQAVAVRINRIWDKRNAAPDEKTRRVGQSVAAASLP